MKIKCEGCNAVYDIKDDKIPEKGINTKCKKCGNNIRVEKNQDAKPGILKQVGERASNIGEITKDVVKRVDREQLQELAERTKKIASEQTSKVDKFLIFSFKFGKIVSAFFVFIFFLTFIGGIVYYFIAGEYSFKTPQYKTYRSYSDGYGKSSSLHDFSDIDTRRKLEDKYGDSIKDIIKDYNFSSDAYDVIIHVIQSIPTNLQDEFFEGFEDFLKDAKKWAIKNDEKNTDYANIAEKYKKMFFKELDNMKKQEGETSELKMKVLASVGASLILFIIFLMIPILIKIEENTRLDKIKSEM